MALAQLHAAREVMRMDGQPVLVVEPMRVEALRAGSRVQMELAATKLLRLADQPLEKRPGMSLPACLWSG